MELNNDHQDRIVVEQSLLDAGMFPNHRPRGRQRARSAPPGVVPDVIVWTSEQYAELIDLVAVDLDGDEKGGR